MLALPIFPGSHPPSIVGANELNFCVRDGNRWTLIAINTNYMDDVFAIFYIKAETCSNSKMNYNTNISLCQEVFTDKKDGDPYRIRTDVNGVRGRRLNHLTNGPLVHLHGLEPGTH